MNNKFIDNLNAIGISINDSQKEQFDKYYNLLVEWNGFMNLTGITEYDEVCLKHYVDSLVYKYPFSLEFNDIISSINKNGLNSLYKKLGIDMDTEKIKNIINSMSDFFNNSISIIDVGTGAGFPGLPIKITFPDNEVVLLDSLNKRIKFLNEVITQVGILNITAIHARAEEAARNKDYREKFDCCVSRAVANLSTLVEYDLPFVKKGGYFVAYKSGNIEEELLESNKAITLMGGKIRFIYKFMLPDSDIERSLVYIEKVKNTPNKFPRKAGLPSKEPIK